MPDITHVHGASFLACVQVKALLSADYVMHFEANEASNGTLNKPRM